MPKILRLGLQKNEKEEINPRNTRRGQKPKEIETKQQNGQENKKTKHQTSKNY